MSKIFETFGKATCAIGTDEFSYHLQSKMCPFSNDGCDKAKRHTVGVCSIKTAAGTYIICPKRFYEKFTVFTEAGKLLIQGDDRIRWIKEVSIGDNFVDFILFSSKNEKAIDFLGLEIQALDTSGSMWKEIEKVLISKGICEAHSLKPFKSVTINWKTTAKTTIMQIIEKAPYFENERKYLVLAIQKPFLIICPTIMNVKSGLIIVKIQSKSTYMIIAKATASRLSKRFRQTLFHYEKCYFLT